MGYLTLIAWFTFGGLLWDFRKYRKNPMPSSLMNLAIIFALSIALTLLTVYVWYDTGRLFSVRSFQDLK
ncbi:hypothetical protein [Erwinia phage vB_Ea277G]|nr:hypothetical protein [Erwinia phage vB_Ea277G]